MQAIHTARPTAALACVTRLLSLPAVNADSIAPLPKGAVETGNGLELGTKKTSGGRIGKDDKGDRIIYIKWIAWRLYMIPTNKIDPLIVFQCWQNCEKDTKHWHPGGCSLTTCCKQDDNENHEGEATCATSQEIEASLEAALSQTDSVTNEIGGEVTVGTTVK